MRGALFNMNNTWVSELTCFEMQWTIQSINCIQKHRLLLGLCKKKQVIVSGLRHCGCVKQGSLCLLLHFIQNSFLLPSCGGLWVSVTCSPQASVFILLWSNPNPNNWAIAGNIPTILTAIWEQVLTLPNPQQFSHLTVYNKNNLF